MLPSYSNWKYYFDLFLIINNPKYGYFNILPTDNSPHEQPYYTMSILNYMRELYIEKLKHDEDNQKIGK